MQITTKITVEKFLKSLKVYSYCVTDQQVICHLIIVGDVYVYMAKGVGASQQQGGLFEHYREGIYIVNQAVLTILR